MQSRLRTTFKSLLGRSPKRVWAAAHPFPSGKALINAEMDPRLRGDDGKNGG